MTKIPKKYKGDKVIKGGPMPDWLVKDTKKEYNLLLKAMDVDYRMKDITNDELVGVEEYIDENIPKKKGEIIREALSKFRRFQWEKIRIMEEELRYVNVMAADWDNRMLYEIEDKKAEDMLEKLEQLSKKLFQ